jgi:hypothetical protein
MATTATEVEERAEKLNPEQERIRGLFSNLNPGDRIFIKRVKVEPNGNFILPTVDVITDFAGIEDIEAETFRRARENHWQPGEYRLHLFQKGRRGIQAETRLLLEPPPPAPTPAPSVALPGAVSSDPVAVMRQAQELMGGKPTPADPMATLTTAVGLLKELTPAGGGETPISRAIEAVLPKIIERLMAPPADPTASLRETLQTLKALGVIGAEPRGVENPVNQLQHLRQVMELVESFGGGGGGPESKSTLVQITEIVGPQLPQMIGQVTATINNAIDLARLKMGLPTGPGGPVVTPTPRPAVQPAGPAAAAQAIFLEQLRRAIRTDDDGFFPTLLQVIAKNIPGGIVFAGQAHRGEIDEEPALNVMGATQLIDPKDATTRAYAFRFLHWLRGPQAGSILDDVDREITLAATRANAAQPPPDTRIDIPSDALEGVCESCGAVYSYGDRNAFDADSQECEVMHGAEKCGGRIALTDAIDPSGNGHRAEP